MNFDDPIVFPGQSRATHLHAFFGNTGVNADSNGTSISTGGNSTCTGGIENRSAYWAPAMIDTATNRPVNQSAGTALDRENALQVYYKTGYRGVAVELGAELPRRAAHHRRRLPTHHRNGASINDAPVTYHCHSRGQGSRQLSFPSCAPGDELVMSVMFPQCWDGINLDSADHKSHMAYGTWGPVFGQNGAGCPASHPVPLAEVTQNYRFRVPATGMATWRLSSDTYSRPRRLLRPRRLVERLERHHLPTRHQQLLRQRPRLPNEPPRRRPNPQLTTTTRTPGKPELGGRHLDQWRRVHPSEYHELHDPNDGTTMHDAPIRQSPTRGMLHSGHECDGADLSHVRSVSPAWSSPWG